MSAKESKEQILCAYEANGGFYLTCQCGKKRYLRRARAREYLWSQNVSKALAAYRCDACARKEAKDRDRSNHADRQEYRKVFMILGTDRITIPL